MTETSTVDVASALEWLRQQFENVTSEAELAAKSVPAWERELMWRAALPLRFDRETIDAELLRDLTNAPADVAEWLVAHPNVEHAALPFPTWGVSEGVRAKLAAVPVAEPGARIDQSHLFDYASRLAGHFRSRGRAWELDALSMLALCEPDLAMREALRLYKRAERTADFTRCFHVLRVLEDRAAQVFALSTWPFTISHKFRELKTGIEELRRRYDASRAFAGDFERTTHVLERKVMRDAWRWISKASPARAKQRKAAPRARPSQWLLNVEARGGAGKTMFLRWLSSRKCLPHGVPYARLDFDFVDPRLTAKAPWYLLAQCARVLDAQLRGRPLSAVVARADDVVPFDAFSLGPADVSRALERLDSPGASTEGQSITEEFGRALAGADAPAFVIVLDTLEVVLLHPQADLLALLGALEELQRGCPRLKVILSGRFTLASRVPDFTARFGARTRTMELDRMSDAESVEYLVKKRRMRDGPLVRAIATRCKGLPFALSLFADEWQVNPKLTPKEVRETPGPELHYLVERVLKRVPEVIAWMLRYGVVARRMTRRFLADVILPELEQLRTSARFDNPLRDTQVLARYFDRARLALGEEALSADLLWADLEKHASAFSFVSHDASREVLVIHEDVLRPLRRELQKHPVLRRLHRRAMDVATAQAGAFSTTRLDAWQSERVEALYHALRISGAEGERAWKAANRDAVRHAAFEAQYLLASEVLSDELTVPATLAVAAARARTEATISASLLDPSRANWDRAARMHREWRGVLRRHQVNADAAFYIAGVNVAGPTGGSVSAGMRALAQALTRARKPEERAALHLALLEANSGHARAKQHIVALERLFASGTSGFSDSAIHRARLVAMHAYVYRGDYANALKVISSRTPILRDLTEAQGYARKAWQVQLLLANGRVADIARVLKGRTPIETVPIQIVTTSAPADLDGWIALRRALIRAHAHGGPRPPLPVANLEGLPGHLRAGELTNEGEQAIARLDASQALAVLQQARQAAGAQHPERAAEALVISARCSAWQLGDLQQAGELIREAALLTLPLGSDAWWQVNYLSALLLDQAMARAAVKRMHDLLRQVSASSPVMRLQAGLAAMAAEKKPSREASLAVLAALRDITPVSARRRCLLELLPNAVRLTLHADIRRKVAQALDLGDAPASTRRTPFAATMEEWLLRKWTWRYPIPGLYGSQVSSSTDFARWVIATDGDGVDAGLDDAMLDKDDASPFARGVATFATAKAYSDAGRASEAARLATRAHELLSSDGVPASVWLARTKLLLGTLAPATGDEESTATLLAGQELYERLGAGDVSIQALLDALIRRVTSTHDDPDPQVLAVELDPVAHGRKKSPINDAMRADATHATSRRTPERVVTALTTNFSGAIRDLASMVPRVTPGDAATQERVRMALVSSHPVVAALPIELAVEHVNEAARTSGRPAAEFAPGWRSPEEPRDAANSSWALRAFAALRISAPREKTADALTASTRAFQHRYELDETGTLDHATLRRMVQALRGDARTRIATIIAGTGRNDTRVLAETLYSRAAADVDVFRGSSVAPLAALREKPYDVIHVVAQLIESASFGGLAFDLGTRQASKASATGRFLSLSEMIGAIKRPESLLRPLIVVHNDLEHLPIEETVRQYCLRNVIALELYRSGSAVATVGLSGPLHGIATPTTALASALIEGEPLVRFLDKVEAQRANAEPRRVARARVRGAAAIAEELQRFAPCVYANNPSYIFV